MRIAVTLDAMLAKRGVRANELARALDMTEANISLLRTGKARAVRFATLSAICAYLDCQPGDLLANVEGPDEEEPIADTNPRA
ncbi:helix-turn-helix domain-containing protein [Sphingoaurantiacus capsulatus]|uniref:Helix-turn-helix domain-containing protein n=1 Tax=Sphingoaurantiacus capsulatus TaxID=1771310 RepID=A0ABV7X9Y5_9SPHN